MSGILLKKNMKKVNHTLFAIHGKKRLKIGAIRI